VPSDHDSRRAVHQRRRTNAEGRAKISACRATATAPCTTAEAARHYDEPALAALILAIASINVWNRLNLTTRQVTGDWTANKDRSSWLGRPVDRGQLSSIPAMISSRPDRS
jgi:hypothetical protein